MTSQTEQEKMVEVNQFFCGLHYLVELVGQAEVCLKTWESIIHIDRKVGSYAHGCYWNGESGETRFIRTVCKSVQERGCGKSGKVVCFAIYLKDELDITFIPRIPFLVIGLTFFCQCCWCLLSLWSVTRFLFYVVCICVPQVLWVYYKVFISGMNATFCNHFAMYSRMLRCIEKLLQRMKHWIIVILTFQIYCNNDVFLVKMITNAI